MRRSIIYAPFRDFIIMLGGIMRSRKHNAPQHKLRTLSQIIMCGRTICPPQAYCAGVVCALLCALHAGALYARVHTLCLRRSMHCAHGIRMKALVLRLASYAFGVACACRVCLCSYLVLNNTELSGRSRSRQSQQLLCQQWQQLSQQQSQQQSQAIASLKSQQQPY